MNSLRLGVLFTSVVLGSGCGCTGLNMTENKALVINLNHSKGEFMKPVNQQQEAIIQLIEGAILTVKNKMVIKSDTQLMGRNHDDQNKILENDKYRAYRFLYEKPNGNEFFSRIRIVLDTTKNAQGEYETNRAVINISNGAYKTNFPYDIFLNRLGLKWYREYDDKGVIPSVSFPNAMYGHWMHGDAFFMYPYQTKEKPEIAVVAMIIESGNGGDINKQTVWGDINMDYPLNIQSIEIYEK